MIELFIDTFNEILSGFYWFLFDSVYTVFVPLIFVILTFLFLSVFFNLYGDD